MKATEKIKQFTKVLKYLKKMKPKREKPFKLSKAFKNKLKKKWDANSFQWVDELTPSRSLPNNTTLKNN